MSVAVHKLKAELSKLKEDKEQSELKLKEEIKKLTKEIEILTEKNEILTGKNEYLKNEIDEIKASNDEWSGPINSKRPRIAEAYAGSMDPILAPPNEVTDSEECSDENSIDRGDDTDGVSAVEDADKISSDVALEPTLDQFHDTSDNQDDDLTSNAWILSPSTTLERIYTNSFVKFVVSFAAVLFLHNVIKIAENRCMYIISTSR